MNWKDSLEQEHFDIHDLITWTDMQVVKCGRKDYRLIYQRFSRMLQRLKEDRRKIFDERFMEPKEDLEMEIPKPPRLQMLRNKIKDLIALETYKELLGKMSE